MQLKCPKQVTPNVLKVGKKGIRRTLHSVARLLADVSENRLAIVELVVRHCTMARFEFGPLEELSPSLVGMELVLNARSRDSLSSEVTPLASVPSVDVRTCGIKPA